MRTMRNLLFVTVMAFVCFGTADAQQATTTLNSRYEVTLGDLTSLMIPNFLALHGSFDVPVLATYEPEPGVIDLEIFGTRDRVEGARESIDNLWSFVQKSINPYFQRRFGLNLGESNYRIIYYNRTARDGSQPVLVFSNGQFLMP